MKKSWMVTGNRTCSLVALIILCGCAKTRVPRDAAEQALDDARRLAESGDYAGALEKHVWFHNHALGVRPSYYGVRLSFALADWVELGQKYPPALEKLRSIRDAKASSLSTGLQNRELFHDVVAINQYLEQPVKTVVLFKEIDGSNPQFASKVYDLAQTALVDNKEYELAKKYLHDPEVRFAHAKENFEEGMRWAKQSGGEDSREAFEQIFTDDVTTIITILKETGDQDRARKIQSEALSVLKSEKVRNALKQ
ncbi:MAG: hypothetical protein C5B50_26215 [Verrucomicrobia bacterium]|nr:MAG: hypothetical protein C5B50_26215 [Verrucomicrobiota bacterium]